MMYNRELCFDSDTKSHSHHIGNISSHGGMEHVAYLREA